jgi:hypothetical protein
MPYPTASCLPFWQAKNTAVHNYIYQPMTYLSESAVKIQFSHILRCWAEYGLEMDLASESKHTDARKNNTYADHALLATLPVLSQHHLLSLRSVSFAVIEYKCNQSAHKQSFLQMIDAGIKRVCPPNLEDPLNDQDVRDTMLADTIPHTPIFAMSINNNSVRLAVIVGPDEIYVDVLQGGNDDKTFAPTDLKEWYAIRHWTQLGHKHVAKRCDQWMWLICKHRDLMFEALKRDPVNELPVFKTDVADAMTAG